MNEWYPLRFRPVYQDYVWGGDRIGRLFGRDVPPGRQAESWEIADRPEGMGVVLNGVLAGRTLHDLVVSMGPDLLGRRVRADVFPLLIKVIDARETLSVQVHPDNESAAGVGGEPKTEMWYVLAADPDACVYCGLQPGVTREAFGRAVPAGTLASMLVRVPVRANDAVYVPGGRVHAIGAGCLLLECQQNSNTTYRIHDWGRVGADGKPRPLHIEQAMKVIRWTDHEPPLVRPRLVESMSHNERWEVLTSPYFRMERYRLREPLVWRRDRETFQVAFVQQGRVRLSHASFAEEASPGQTYLIPAACPDLALQPVGDAPVQLLTMSLP